LRLNMLSPVAPRNWFGTGLKAFAITLLVVCATLPLTSHHLSAQDMPVIIGRIEGDDVMVKTTVHGGVEINAAPTVLAGWSEVTLRSGHALLRLNAGGEISICGPAHFTLFNSAGAVTLALDYGRVHPSLDSQSAFTIYTPMIVATPVAISDARRDTTLGLDQNGEMCILTTRGAMRIEPQFSGGSLIVPQGGVVNFANGQLEPVRGDASSCTCDFPEASAGQALPSTSKEISTLRQPLRPEQKKQEAGAPAAAQEPVYTVHMPPLTFDARSPSPPPDPSPETIILVREVRVRPSVFYGHVNPAPVQAPAPPPTQAVSAKDQRPAQAHPGILARMRNLFRKLIGQ
jgi:hypothetical protein